VSSMLVKAGCLHSKNGTTWQPKEESRLKLLVLRLLCHAHALIQIHKAIATGTTVVGWILQGGLVTRADGTGRECGDDVLDVKKIDRNTEVLWVKSLDKQLEFVQPH